jgi:hypothetical protein
MISKIYSAKKLAISTQITYSYKGRKMSIALVSKYNAHYPQKNVEICDRNIDS